MLVSNRANTLLLVLILAVGIGIIGMLASGARGGPLDPLGPPASTDGVLEPGTPISSLPFTIASPGRYYLTRNLTSAGGGADGITITAFDVTLDLGGFTVDGKDRTGSAIAISSVFNTTIENGTLKQFENGIVGGTSVNTHVVNVSVTDYGNFDAIVGVGIRLGEWGLVDGCTLKQGEGSGIELLSSFSAVRGCRILSVEKDGVLVSDSSTVETSFVDGGDFGINYNIRVSGQDVTIRNNILNNIGARDIGVGANFALILDNEIHCPTSIVNLGAFSYDAPVNGEAHSKPTSIRHRVLLSAPAVEGARYHDSLVRFIVVGEDARRGELRLLRDRLTLRRRSGLCAMSQPA